MTDAELLTAAHSWLADDPDPATRETLSALIIAAEAGEAEALAELRDCFRGMLEFGTAGLRGALGPGPNRMNRAVVSRAAAGLSQWLRKVPALAADRSPGGAVVIGFDARHRSDDFALDTAQIATGAGLPALVLPRPLPTPVLAFAVRHLGAAAGVMVTASHNPPQDNGYKVYLGLSVGDGYDGSQIVPPVDREIAAEIDAVSSVQSIARGEEWVTLDDSVLEEYIARTTAIVDPTTPRDLRIVYTALHGVGGATMLQVLNRVGFRDVNPVRTQFMPDPDFPTVAFPNPEEPGAIDAALAVARDIGADLVLANDPDADRAAAALADRDGIWRMLRGDQVGVLLGWWLLERARRAGTPLQDSDCFAASIVSSSLLGRMAATAGIGYAETLTGFKWISRVPGLRFGYEEALGYCVDPSTVKDKDGISAALLIAELTAALKAEGRTPWDVLDDLARQHGLHQTDQVSIRVSDLSRIDAVMQQMRTQPPTQLAGRAVTAIDDLRTGVNGLPPTDGIRLWAEGIRVIVRPSGTEPKIKCYLEVVVPGDDLAHALGAAADLLARLRSQLTPLLT